MLFRIHAGLLSLLTCALLHVVVSSSSAAVHYVRSDAAGAGTGANWTDAYTSLNAALAAATAGDQIWVAAGTYRPTAGADRSASFVLASGVTLLGGFPGLPGQEDDLGPRDPAVHVTILSGDIGEPGVAADNSYHVITASGVDDSGVVDGFTVTAGNANDTPGSGNNVGGGLRAVTSSLTIINCRFVDNGALVGAAISNEQGSPRIIDCVFVDNLAANGAGAIYNTGEADAILIRCTFTNNSAIIGSSAGGAIINENGSDAMLAWCVFEGNSAGFGGAIMNFGSSPRIVNTILRNNTAAVAGGALYNDNFTGASLPLIVNSALLGNRASADNSMGGAVYNDTGCDATFVNCTLAGNTADQGHAIHSRLSTAVLTNCIVWDNSGGPGGPVSGGATITYSDIQGGWTGTGNINADPLFVDGDGPDGTYGTADDDIRLGSGSPAVDAGNNDAVPADFADLDDDADTAEKAPLDVYGAPRFVDIPGVADTGVGPAPIVDMGAAERQPAALLGDVDGDGAVTVLDVILVVNAFGTQTGEAGFVPGADFDNDGQITVLDVITVVTNFGRTL